MTGRPLTETPADRRSRQFARSTVPTLPTAPPLPPNASAGRKWRFRRDLVICVAARGGCSQRLLADVFDLPRSRIATIIKAREAALDAA